MTDDYERELIDQLTDDDPIQRDSEGLWECCFYCGSCVSEDRKGDGREIWAHNPNCPWLEAMEYLGRPAPDHVWQEKR